MPPFLTSTLCERMECWIIGRRLDALITTTIETNKQEHSQHQHRQECIDRKIELNTRQSIEVEEQCQRPLNIFNNNKYTF